jgi:acyl-coenzyme A thioesterase PaaI-like protein
MSDAPSDHAGSPDPSPSGGPFAGPGSSDWGERLRQFAVEPPSPRRAELHRTSDALRTIIDTLHGSDAPVAELASVADELESLASRLDAFPGGSIYEGFSESTLAGRDPHAFFDHSPVLGRANPLAPPLYLQREGDLMRALARFGTAYEGPPGCVHGGFVAAAFDEVLGSAQSLGGRPGMTGRLTVNYRSPTPLHTELRFEGWVDRVEGRKTFTLGTLHAGDRLCAEAEGLFIAIDVRKYMELRRQREERLGSPSASPSPSPSASVSHSTNGDSTAGD